MANIRTAVIQIKRFISITAEDFTKYFKEMELKNSVNFVFVEEVGSRIRVIQEKFGTNYPSLQFRYYF